MKSSIRVPAIYTLTLISSSVQELTVRIGDYLTTRRGKSPPHYTAHISHYNLLVICLLACQHRIHVANRIPINHLILTAHRWLRAASLLSSQLQNLSSTLLCSALLCCVKSLLQLYIQHYTDVSHIPTTRPLPPALSCSAYWESHYPPIASCTQLPQRLVSSSECCRSQLSL